MTAVPRGAADASAKVREARAREVRIEALRLQLERARTPSARRMILAELARERAKACD